MVEGIERQSLATIDYSAEYLQSCLDLFDQNTPRFFAVNERKDYQQFLDTRPRGYRLVFQDQVLVASFGLIQSDVAKATQRARLSWIMVEANSSKSGLGNFMMSQVQSMAEEKAILQIDIAASHLSQSYFERYGAKKVSETPNGWGEGMHRVDMELSFANLTGALAKRKAP